MCKRSHAESEIVPSDAVVGLSCFKDDESRGFFRKKLTSAPFLSDKSKSRK